jgi:uncharacterized membrane protein YphA (DoxX/SURF4 family)
VIRLAVGGVFFASGLIKFLYANQGAGRFAKLGIPAPELMANLVGVVEIAGGLLLAVGLATRLAAIPLLIDMLVAIGTSKLPLLFGPGPEPVAAAPKVGLWAFLYQARLDSTMLLSCLFLFAVGAGAWSLDAWRTASERKSSQGLRQGRLGPWRLRATGDEVLPGAPEDMRRLSRRLPRGA